MKMPRSWWLGVLPLLLGFWLWWNADRPAPPPPLPAVPPPAAPLDLPPPVMTQVAEPMDTPLWVVWYDDGARVYRLQVERPAHNILYQTLQQALIEDQERLNLIAEKLLRRTMEEGFAALPEQVPAFAETLSGWSMGAGLLYLGLDVAARPDVTAEEVDEQLADQVAVQFRRGVLVADSTVHALRGASKQILEQLRRDLLLHCDRYDRAFQHFVLMAQGTVENLDGEAGWQPDSSWQHSTATFRSLCTGLRQVNASHSSDPVLRQVFAQAEARVRQQARHWVRPVADTARTVRARVVGMAQFWERQGLTPGLAKPMASALGYTASAGTLVAQLYTGLDVPAAPKIMADSMNQVLDALREATHQQLQQLYRDFITAELERVQIGLAARGTGAWSQP